jgi:hypothetical protein
MMGLAFGRGAGNEMQKSKQRAATAATKADAAFAKADAALRAKIAERDAEIAATLASTRAAATAFERERFFPKKGDAEVIAIGIAWSPRVS